MNENPTTTSSNKHELAIIDLPQIGKPEEGYISVAEINHTVPFIIKRVYWTYYTPHHIIRGRHAHKSLYQIIIAVSGIIEIATEDRNRKKKSFILDSPNKGLLLPPHYWHTMQFSHNAVLLSLCSMEYDESDYIRSYEEFIHGNNS
ncbi:MAG: WxcM-like domain-containing protein [Bacteroidetes bacterium]|nr:MAG: WxcM-like domain-containing protein [Bacteroidota bacterium]